MRPWVANTDGIVYAMTQIGPRVYLGGAFLHVGGHGRPRLAVGQREPPRDEFEDRAGIITDVVDRRLPCERRNNQ